MATWEKVKFFYDTMLGASGSTLTASSTLAGTDVINIYNMLEVNRWEAVDAAEPQYITWSANRLLNSNFENWTGGTPDYWSLFGAGATVAAEISTVKKGATSANVTRAGTDAELSQSISAYADLLGKTFSLGVWVFASSSTQARLAVSDGIKTSYSTYHSGTGGWEFLTASLTLSQGATDLKVSLQVQNTDGSVFFDVVSGGEAKSADYLAVMGHDFYSSGGVLTLEASDDDFTDDIQGVLSVRPLSDRIVLTEARFLANPDFEVWDNGNTAPPTGWRLGGGPSGSINKESLTVFNGLYSARVSSAANEDLWLEATESGNAFDLSYLSGKTVTFGCYINAAVAGRVTLRIYDDDGTGPQFTEGAVHSGAGAWQFMSVTRTLRAGLKGINLRCYVSTGQAATLYIDNAAVRVASSLQPGELSDYAAVGTVNKRHWRLKMSGLGTAPHMNICIWGDKTELDYATAAFDPHGEQVRSEVNVSNTGYIMGVHTRYSERRISLAFREADAALYEKVKSWWENSGLKNFFVGWERGNNPDDVFLMFPEKTFNNPFQNGGLFRDINIKLKGRKE